MMKREDRGKMNELCERLRHVESALERHRCNAWERIHLRLRVGKDGGKPSYNGSCEIDVELDSTVALKILRAEEERIRSALADIGVAP